MRAFERIAEEKIRQAVAEGKFDDLRGKGKPLQLVEHPFEHEEQRLVHIILKSNDVKYDWMEIGKEIEVETKKAISTLIAISQAEDSEHKLQTARLAFLRMIAALNRRILDYNGRVPAPAFERKMLNAEEIWQSALADAA